VNLQIRTPASTPSYLACFQNLKHEGQALGDEFLCVLLLLDGLELLEQALDERPTVLLEGNPQRLQPCVQSPRDTWKGRGTREGGRGGEEKAGKKTTTGGCMFLSGSWPFPQGISKQ
jgi:hypothetical protein